MTTMFPMEIQMPLVIKRSSSDGPIASVNPARGQHHTCAQALTGRVQRSPMGDGVVQLLLSVMTLQVVRTQANACR